MDRTGRDMQITETVRWAYRLVLGRDPESEAVIDHWASLGDGRTVLSYFVKSPEAQANREAGSPAWGHWLLLPPDAALAIAAHHLRFNTTPSAREIDAALAGHDSLASFRKAFLHTPEVLALVEQAPAPAAPVTPRPAPAAARPATGAQEHRFTVLDQPFILRGEGHEEYWRGLVDGPPDPSVNRLARLIRAAFPDGGAGRVLVDAGANIGMTSLTMAAAAPDHAALLCFEPDERSISLLQHNLAANRLTYARAMGMALGDRDDTVRFRRGTDNTATSFVLEPYSRAQMTGAQVVDVPMRRLDNVLAELDLGRLDLLKIDVEGAETAVMLGASEAIARDRPIIFTEFNIWTQMTAGGRNPMEVLEEWRAAFNHMVTFDDLGRPLPLMDRDGLLWVLHEVLTRRGAVDDLVLCDDLAWVDRWA